MIKLDWKKKESGVTISVEEERDDVGNTTKERRKGIGKKNRNQQEENVSLFRWETQITCAWRGNESFSFGENKGLIYLHYFKTRQHSEITPLWRP